jgi:hypothetical protein
LRNVRVEQLRALKMKNDLREHAVIAVSESQLALDTVCAYVCMTRPGFNRLAPGRG